MVIKTEDYWKKFCKINLLLHICCRHFGQIAVALLARICVISECIWAEIGDCSLRRWMSHKLCVCVLGTKCTYVMTTVATTLYWL